MSPVIGQGIVIAVICVITFFAARATLRNIKAELRGEATCAGCSGCGQGKSSGGTCALSGGNSCGSGEAQCYACMKKMEELKALSKTRN